MKKKTTVSVNFSGGSYFIYTGYIPGYCFVSFYGTNAKKWDKLWQEFKETKINKEREKFTNSQKENIKRLEDELTITPKTWFFNKRKKIKELLEEEKNRSFYFGEFSELYAIYEFLPNDCVKISNYIYEIISPIKIKKYK